MTSNNTTIYHGLKDLLIENSSTPIHVKDSNTKHLMVRASKILFGEKQTLSYQQQLETVRFIVEHVMQLTPQQFYNLYSTKLITTFHIRSAINNILYDIPDHVKEKYCFINKDMLFAELFPELYGDRSASVSTADIYYCKGTIKANLSAAGSMKIFDKNNQAIHTSKRNYGAIVDKICYNAISTELTTSGMTDFREQLEYMIHYQEIYKENKAQIPGVYEVIMNRGCYMNALDFLMFNAPEQTQMMYFDDYMELREEAGYPRIAAVDAMYEAYQVVAEEISYN